MFAGLVLLIIGVAVRKAQTVCFCTPGSSMGPEGLPPMLSPMHHSPCRSRHGGYGFGPHMSPYYGGGGGGGGFYGSPFVGSPFMGSPYGYSPPWANRWAPLGGGGGGGGRPLMRSKTDDSDESDESSSSSSAQSRINLADTGPKARMSTSAKPAQRRSNGGTSTSSTTASSTPPADQTDESPLAPAARALAGEELPDDFDSPDNRFNYLQFTSTGQHEKAMREAPEVRFQMDPIDNKNSKLSTLPVDFV